MNYKVKYPSNNNNNTIDFQEGSSENIVTKYVMGLDSNDSNFFKINAGTSLNASSHLKLDTTGNLTISGSITANNFIGNIPIDQFVSGQISLSSGGTNNNNYVHSALLYYDNSTNKLTNHSGLVYTNDLLPSSLYSFSTHTFNTGVVSDTDSTAWGGRIGPRYNQCLYSYK